MATNEQDGRPEGAAPQDPMSQAAAQSAAAPMKPEESLRSARCCKRNFYPQWLVWFVGTVVLIIAAWKIKGTNESNWSWYAAGAIIALGALYLAFRMGTVILTRRYRLTTQRLFIDRGFLSRTTDQTELIRVDDVQVQQSLLQRIFSVGDVKVLSQTDASDNQIVMAGLDDPHGWSEDIRQNMKIMRKKSLFVEQI